MRSLGLRGTFQYLRGCPESSRAGVQGQVLAPTFRQDLGSYLVKPFERHGLRPFDPRRAPLVKSSGTGQADSEPQWNALFLLVRIFRSARKYEPPLIEVLHCRRRKVKCLQIYLCI